MKKECYRRTQVGRTMAIRRAVVVGVCGMLVGVALCGDVSGSDGKPLVRYLFTIESFYEDTFNTPTGIFVDRESGEVYVADNGRSEVMIFATDGAPVFRFGRLQGVMNPFDLVVKDGLIYLSQEGKDYIEIFNYRGISEGRLSAPEGMDFSPGKLYLSDDDRLYVVNKARSVCMVFHIREGFMGTIGRRFSSMTAVAVGDDRVYILTPFDERVIHVYTRDGKHIMSFEGLDGKGGTLGLPISAEVDGEGNLWLLDALKGIVIYDKKGKEITRFGDYGTKKGQVFFPVDIDFGEENMLYLVEKGAKRISVFKVDR